MPQKISHIILLCMTAAICCSSQDRELLHSSFVNDSGEYEVQVIAGDKDTRIDIFRHDGKSELIAHYVGEALAFVYARPSPKMDQLAAIWETGSGVFVTVFRLAPVRADQPVLAKSTDSQPEFVHIGAGEVMLLYSGRRHLGNYWVPETASLYLWNGTQYRLTKTVPYESRFEALIALQDKESRSQIH